MADFKTLLVAVAFSPYSEGIMGYAAQLANRLDAQIIVASIINQRDVAAVRRVADMGYDVDGPDYIAGIKDERSAALAKLFSKSSISPQKIKTVFKVGNPIEELLKIIVAEEVDMVIMGVKGRSDLEYALVGSVAEKMFRRSPVTVVSYRDAATAQRLRKRINL